MAVALSRIALQMHSGDDLQVLVGGLGLGYTVREAVWSYAESSLFADALREVFEEVYVEAVTYENRLIDQHETDWLFFARAVDC